jgi:hypothetical protein
MKLIKLFLTFFEGIITSICYIAVAILYAGYLLEKAVFLIFNLLANLSLVIIIIAGLMYGLCLLDQLEPTDQNVGIKILIFGSALGFISIITLALWKPKKFNKIFGKFEKIKIKKNKGES